MTDVPLDAFLRAAGLFRTQVRDEFGKNLVADVLEPLEAEYRAMAEATEAARAQMRALRAGLERNAESTGEWP